MRSSLDNNNNFQVFLLFFLSEERGVQSWTVSYFPGSYRFGVLDAMEGAQLGQVGRVIVRNQFGCISELHGKDPGGLLISTAIPGPVDEIQQLAVTAALVDLRVEDLGDLKFQLAIYEDRQGWRLYSVRDQVQGCRFQHQDVEHRVDGMEVVW